MIAFEIHLNGRALGTAGVGARGVLSAIATWVRRISRHPRTGRALKGRFDEELTFDVGGLTEGRDGTNIHLNWMRRRLKVGDEIRVKVVETGHVAQPRKRRREDPQDARRQKRRYYEQLKREFGD